MTTNGDEMIARRRRLPRLGRGAQIIAVIALVLSLFGQLGSYAPLTLLGESPEQVAAATQGSTTP